MRNKKMVFSPGYCEKVVAHKRELNGESFQKYIFDVKIDHNIHCAKVKNKEIETYFLDLRGSSCIQEKVGMKKVFVYK